MTNPKYDSTAKELLNSDNGLSIDGKPSMLTANGRLANFFAAHRRQSGLNLESVSQALGFEDTSTLIRYESGDTPIPLDDIFALTNALNIAPEEVLGLIFDISHQAQPDDE